MNSLINISRIIIVALCLLSPKLMLAQVDYDTDNNGLIDVSTLEQLNAIRWDLDGDGAVDSGNQSNYGIAFPTAAGGTTYGVITCGNDPPACAGYELMNSLDFNDTDPDMVGNQFSKWAKDCSSNCVTGTQADGSTTDNIGWEPIGGRYNPNPFVATFDGGSNTISNLYIDRSTDYVGLFGYIGTGGEVRDLGVVRGSVKGSKYAGGLVGQNNSGTINGCYATGGHAEETGNSGSAGGLVGKNRQGTINGCYATGNATGTEAGGLVGQNDVGTNSTSTRIIACYATGYATGDSNAGGLVGFSNGGTISACYATGYAIADTYVGGLVGLRQQGTISACYSTGNAISPFGTVGGLVGHGLNGISYSYFDSDASNRPASDPYSKTTAELQSPTDYTGIYQDWNIDLDGDSSPNDPWDFGTSMEYPVFKSVPLNSDPPIPPGTNEGTPRFANVSYTFTQDEEVVIGTAVVGLPAISATDPENDDLEYSLTDNGSGRFRIDTQTGVISNAQVIDYETTLTSAERTAGGEIELTVQVSDNATPPNTAMANVTITITDVDEEHMFVNTPYTFMVNESETFIGQVVVEDPENATVTYRIDPVSTLFEIDANGEIRVQAGQSLDYANNATHAFMVEATAGGHTISTNVLIEVSDPSVLSFARGTYTFTQNEEVVIGTAVVGTLAISAMSPNASAVLTYTLIDDGSGRFKIDTQSGVISNAQVIDYETTLTSAERTAGGEIELTVQVSDNATPPNTAMANVTITITDVEDVVMPFFNVSGADGSLYVYPNPTSGEVELAGFSADKTYICKVYSLLGQEMFSTTIKHKIDLSSLVEGQYVLVLLTEEKELLRTRLLIVR